MFSFTMHDLFSCTSNYISALYALDATEFNSNCIGFTVWVCTSGIKLSVRQTIGPNGSCENVHDCIY